MKLLRILALLAPVALAFPMSAHAAMDKETRSTFTTQCEATAREKLDAKSAATHCKCGADQVDKNFNDKQIAQLKDTTKAPDPGLTAKLQSVIAKNCVQTKK
ncbi:hypothetical protein AABC73_18090 [Pseudomonas sp. G.S.17]|uniref:hypothetical protein n=1 Tax=Pseudomonas sp. G.S.17 TaxID=3137451 RepID=UPI00311C94BE